MNRPTAEILLDYAMHIAHERELAVTGHKHDSDGAVNRFKAAVDRALAPPCEYCDDTGDVHSADGEWRGTCVCPAGQALKKNPSTTDCNCPSTECTGGCHER